jgi:antitoxin FitA
MQSSTTVQFMATLTIRNLNEEVKRSLRIRAASHGRSMEAEARLLLARSLTPDLQIEEDCNATIRGKWKGKFTTDEVLAMTRGED